MSANINGGDAWTRAEAPFHDGEIEIQQKLGVAGKSERLARRLFSDHMPSAHRDFFATLPYCFLGAVDEAGRPQATVMWGEPGFIDAKDELHIEISSELDPADPAAEGLKAGALVGVLGLDMATRVRFRTNCTVRSHDDGVLSLAVLMSYPSCPQYIQARKLEGVEPHATTAAPAPQVSARLDERARKLISECDTFFIASVSLSSENVLAHNADVSHRGGKKGFVRVDDDVTLTPPDYAGNFIFNTLGNLLRDSRAGLLFIDFETGDVLHANVRAEVIWEGEEVDAFVGAQRLVKFHVEGVVLRPGLVPLRYGQPEFSPVLNGTGSWEAAERALEANRLRETWRPFVIESRVPESECITSFYLVPEDGNGVAHYEAGQHVPVLVTLADGREEVRSYSLSAAKNSLTYRISVKREAGGVSEWLHDVAGPGSKIQVKAPRGVFTYASVRSRPMVLVSAGVGLTPMMSFLDSLLIANSRSLHAAPILFLHGARDGASHAFRTWTDEKTKTHANFSVHYAYSRPGSADAPGRDYHSGGRINADLIVKLRPADECDYYVCGPAAFMQEIYGGLRAQGVADEHIFAESFGPSQLKRDRTQDIDGAPVEIEFARSGRTEIWRPGDGSLLDLAEKAGLEPVHTCRVGNCGTCRTRLVSGVVDYETTPVAPIREGYALICCARPLVVPCTTEPPARIVLDL